MQVVLERRVVPNDAERLLPVEVRIVTVRHPPAGLLKVSAMHHGPVSIPIRCAEAETRGARQGVAGVAIVTTDLEEKGTGKNYWLMI